jgi:hypothetical protein
MKKQALFALSITLAVFFGSVAETFAQSVPVTNGQAVNQGLGFSSSRNWAGYAMNGSNYTSVSGTWVIPTVPVSSGLSGDATWVGIGGVSDQDLIQAGTDAIISGGSLTYEAWYEIIPDAQVFVPLAISSGDSLSVSITEQSSGLWLITMTNNTTGKIYQKNISYNSSRSSAEWIEEMPSMSDGNILPLDSFGSVTFTNTSATTDGSVVNLSTGYAQPITLIDRSSQTLASPSGLLSDTSFTVTRSNVSANNTTYAVTSRNRLRRSGHGEIHYYIIPDNSTAISQSMPQWQGTQQIATASTTTQSPDPRIQALYQQIAQLTALIRQLQLAQASSIQNSQQYQITIPLQMFLSGDTSSNQLFFSF